MRKALIISALVLFVIAAVGSGVLADRVFNFKFLDRLFPRSLETRINQKIVTEESMVTDVVKAVGPSVVTVSTKTPERKVLQFSPFGGFSQEVRGGTQQDIGSGFVVSKDGLIVTNKHVVNDSTLSYKVSTSDGKNFDVVQIDKDPSNDIAVLKIEASDLAPVELGDSGALEVGQFVIAIGTALGEFRNTVTTGVVSGLGRGIQAGSPLQGYVEELDNVIQTDAAINSGNSGGPLLNSAGQVIGVNVAVAQGAQNVGFAIPINTIKEALAQYKTNGKFPAKPYLGVEYQMIPKETAILNNVPQGAYVVNVLTDSPAQKAGIEPGDIILKIEGNALDEDKKSLSKLMSAQKVGNTITVIIWREGEEKSVSVTLTEFKQ